MIFMDFDEPTWASRYKTRVEFLARPFCQKIDAPNGMQMIELNETPKNEMQKKYFDL